jgi:5-aminolevulinate synthase
MNFDKLFQAQLDQLKEEGNYRIFAELQRNAGASRRSATTPTGRTRSPSGVPTTTSGWVTTPR